ncbi:MAG TPA: metallopeptidase TldD-related protein [Kofleriaceae bacterium]|nr:metallopeptidase TldD-related protein [Kofleriaceae bacterium]
MLTGIGASTLAWAFGCHRAPPATPHVEVSGEVRSWLRDAVARLAGVFTYARATAVTRRRTTAAIDVLGTGVSRAQVDTVLLRVRDADGGWREHVGSVLTRDGVAAAVHALVGDSTKVGSVRFGTPRQTLPVLGVDPRRLSDHDLHERVQQIAKGDGALTSRIVYAAASIDVDDATIWSISRDSDREQRLVRVRRSATRVAWNGTHPVVTEASAGWTGGIDDRQLDPVAVQAATSSALELITPDNFEDGTYMLALHPSVVATIIDASVRGLLTSAAARRPEVANRLAIGAGVASPLLSLADDPTQPGAYGGFAFDDDGQPATRTPLVDAGHIVGRLDRALRPGHVGLIEPRPSHLQLAAGTSDSDLVSDGFALERGQSVVIDPSSDRIVVAVSRAREWRGGRRTGRVFADIELVGELGTLLASVTAVGNDSTSFAIRDESDGLPRWRSIEAPSLRIRGALRARRIA